jgi:hypothetical protein
VDTITAIRQRRTVRKFEQKPVSREVLAQIVDCARLAPQGKPAADEICGCKRTGQCAKSIDGPLGCHIAPAENSSRTNSRRVCCAGCGYDIKKNSYDIDADAAGRTLILAARNWVLAAAGWAY